MKLFNGLPRSSYYAWQLKHPDAKHHKPLHHPDDTNHVRHALRRFNREAEKGLELIEKMKSSAGMAGR